MPNTATVVEARPGTTNYPTVEEIVQAWREYNAKASNNEMDKKLFEQEGTLTQEFFLRDVSYSDIATLPSNPWRAAAVTYRNGSDIEQSITYETSEQVATTTTATVEKSTDVEGRFELSVKWPASDTGVTESLTVKTGRRDVNSTAKSVTDVRRISMPVRVPPHQVISAQAHATKKTQQVTWTARMTVLGTWASWVGSSGVEGHLPDILIDAREWGIMDTPGWEFKRMNEAQMREAIGNPTFDRLYPRESGRNTSFALATGLVTGTMTFENFVDITVEVRQLDTAYAGASTEDREAGDRAVQGGKVIDSFPVPEPAEFVARQEKVLGTPVTVYERR